MSFNVCVPWWCQVSTASPHSGAPSSSGLIDGPKSYIVFNKLCAVDSHRWRHCAFLKEFLLDSRMNWLHLGLDKEILQGTTILSIAKDQKLCWWLQPHYFIWIQICKKHTNALLWYNKIGHLLLTAITPRSLVSSVHSSLAVAWDLQGCWHNTPAQSLHSLNKPINYISPLDQLQREGSGNLSVSVLFPLITQLENEPAHLIFLCPEGQEIFPGLCRLKHSTL